MTQGWYDIFNIVIGAASVPLISFLKNIKWSKYAKVFLAAIVPLFLSGSAGVSLEGLDLLEDEVSGGTSVLLSLLGANFWYKICFEDTRAEERLAKKQINLKNKEGQN